MYTVNFMDYPSANLKIKKEPVPERPPPSTHKMLTLTISNCFVFLKNILPVVLEETKQENYILDSMVELLKFKKSIKSQINH